MTAHCSIHSGLSPRTGGRAAQRLDHHLSGSGIYFLSGIGICLLLNMQCGIKNIRLGCVCGMCDIIWGLRCMVKGVD